MENVIKLLSKRIKQRKIFSKKDILRIYALLIDYFQVITINDVSFVKPNTEKYFMGYHVDNFKIHIDYHQINKSADVRKTNYEILFAILHEIRHAKQMEYVNLNKNVLGYIYRGCFDFIRNLNNITSIYYHLYHSFFPIEVNANISAYYYMVHICNSLGDEVYKAYYEELMLDSLNNDDKCNQESLLKILFDEEFIIEIKNSLSSYDLAIHGLEMDRDVGKKVLSMLL